MEKMIQKEKKTNLNISSLAKGSGISFFGGVYEKIIRLILNFVLTRFLGASLYGIYVLAITILNILQKISSFGQEEAMLRFNPVFFKKNYLKKVKGLSIFSMTSTFLIGIFFGGALFILSNFLEIFFELPGLSKGLRIIAIALPIYNLLYLSCALFKSAKKMSLYVGIYNILFPTINLILVAAIFLCGFKLIGAMTIFLITLLLVLLINLLILKKKFDYIFLKKNKPVINFKRVFNFSGPVYLTGIVNLLQQNSSILFLGFFLGSTSVGIYNIAIKISLLLLFLTHSIIQIFYPLSSQLPLKNQRSDLQKIYNTATRWSFLLAMPLFIIMILIPKSLLGLFGAEFVNGAQVLIILSITYLLQSGLGFGGIVLQTHKKQNFVLLNFFTALCINIILNIILIPKLGIIGAAIAMAVSIIFLDGHNVLATKYLLKLRLPFNLQIIKIILAGGVCFSIIKPITNLLGWPKLILIPILVFFVFFGLILLFGLPNEDIHLIAKLRSLKFNELGRLLNCGENEKK